MSSASTHPDFWRGACEGIAVSYAPVFKQLRLVNPTVERVIASGGATQSHPGLMDIVAQALGFPIQVVNVKRVTMRGAAVMALATLNPDQRAARIPETALTEPDPSQLGYCASLRERFASVYDGVIR